MQPTRAPTPRSDAEAAQVARELLETDHDRGVALLDPEGRVLYRNPAAAHMLRDGTPRGRETLLPASIEQWISAFADRVRGRRDPSHQEAHYPSEEDRRLRLRLDHWPREEGMRLVLRVQSAQPWSVPSVRRLQSLFGLTLREAQVAALVARGLTNTEAGARLGIVEKTVKNVLMTVYSKCGVRNRVELALRSYQAPVGADSADE